jgi:hypothetical protein
MKKTCTIICPGLSFYALNTLSKRAVFTAFALFIFFAAFLFKLFVRLGTFIFIFFLIHGKVI